MSVAIRTAVRIQDQDDAPTLGAGQNGYALTWDNASGAFVATALFTGGLLATGATAGATSQAQAFTNGVVTGAIKPAADSTTALQMQNAAGAPVVTLDTQNKYLILPRDAALIIGNYPSQPFVYFTASSTEATFVAAGIPLTLTSGWNSVITLSNGAAGYDAGKVYIPWGNLAIGTDAPASKIHALLTSAATNAVSNVLTLGHDTSGTPAAGFGAGLLYQLESSTTAGQSAARIQALWYEATHATFKADLVGTAYDAGGEREGWRVRGNGSAAAIGFLGAAPIARIAHVADPAGGATVDAEARSAINSILATLEGFGFHATS